jgi:hypothetical protein
MSLDFRRQAVDSKDPLEGLARRHRHSARASQRRNTPRFSSAAESLHCHTKRSV